MVSIRDWIGRLMPSRVQTLPTVALDDLDPYTYSGQQNMSPWDYSIWDGGKFPGGFGPTQIWVEDYWTMRQRSAQLFTSNLYARGLIRRLVTNEINTGLTPEACPEESVIGVPDESLTDWCEDTETRYGLWAASPLVCDWYGRHTFGELQSIARSEAFVCGDVLVVLRQSQRTRMPMVQLISGDRVRTPLAGLHTLRAGHSVQHGVETDAVGRVVAHWVSQEDGSYRRIPAYGEKSGRKISWLVYGTDKRLDALRGQPLLSLVMQSLQEIDRYRDSVQRKAVINSVLAMFIKKSEDKPGTLPITGGAVRNDSASVTDGDGRQRTYNIAQQIPGMVLEELQTGEEPVGFHNQGTDDLFGRFEEAIIQAVAWANEVPPEILRLAFSNNYSASQAAINEFKIYLNKIWTTFGNNFCAPVYVDWLISSTLSGRTLAPGLLDAWRDPMRYDVFAAWTSAEWYGSIKPSTDMLKQAKGSKLLISEGWSTNAREARVTTGTKFSRNIKRLKRENELKADMMRPIAEFNAEFGGDPGAGSTDVIATDEMEAAIDEYLSDRGL